MSDEPINSIEHEQYTGLQKLILTFFILTIVLVAASLSYFFIETPYKSKPVCVENTSAIQGDSISHTVAGYDGTVLECSYSDPKELSPFHDAIINASGVCATIFIGLSGYAYYLKRKKES